MARKERIEVAKVDHSLEAFNAREDERLKADAASSTMKARKAIEAASPDGPAQLVSAPAPADDLAQWRDEIAVVRFLATNGEPRAFARAIGGELGRAFERRELGTSGPKSGTRAFEPSISDHHLAAWAVWRTLEDEQRDLLVRMFLSLTQISWEPDGGAQKVAPRIRELAREGAVLEANGTLCAHVGAGVTIVDASKLTPTWLLAMVLGRVKPGADEDAKQQATTLLAREVNAARVAFRDRLRAVDLSDAHHQVRKPLLIPSPKLQDLERGREAETVVCAGPIAYEPLELAEGEDAAAWIAAHPRPTCDVARVTADTSSWARCEACGKAKVSTW